MEQMGFEDLRSMAIIDPYFSTLATYIFKRKLPKFSVEFDFEDLKTDRPNDVINATELLSKNSYEFFKNCCDDSKRNFYTHEDSVEIQKPCIIFNMLEHFGDAIKKLKLNIGVWNDHYEPVVKFMVDHCAENLIDLEMVFPYQLQNAIFQRMTNRFEAVKNLAFQFHLNVTNSSLSMDQLFPQLRKLRINLLNKIQSDYVACHFPHLEYLEISTNQVNDEPIESIEEMLIKLNPQIRRISFSSPSLRLVQTIAAHSTQLEHLSIVTWDNFGAIRFPSVKTLEMTFLGTGDITLRFQHLQELRINCFANGCNTNWAKFLQNHPDLKRLHIEDLEHGCAFVPLFSRYLPNLEELSISFFDEVHVRPDPWIEYLRGADKLNKLRFEWNELFTEEERDRLRKNLKQQWTITENVRGFVFERIQL